MKKTAIATLVAATMATAAPAFAGVSEELAAMKARIAQLESQLADQQAAIASQQASSSTSGGFADNVTVSGALELLVSNVKEDGGDSENDIEVDTFELEIAAQINDMVAITAVIEADEDDIVLDDAYAVIGNDESIAQLTIGKTGVPFAAINDAGWTSPLTDDVADMTEGLAMVSFGGEMVSADVYTYAADGDDTIGAYGFNLELAAAEGITLGAGYISEETTEGDFGGGNDAWRVNGLFETGPFAFSAEYIRVDAPSDPNALALNAAYNTNLMGEDATLYLGWSELDDSGMDAERTVVGVERAFGENASIVAEYVHDEVEGDPDTNTVNLVLVTEF